MFLIDKPGSGKPTYLFIKKKLSDGNFKRSLGIKIQAAHWLKKTRRLDTIGLDRITTGENKSINALLSEIEKYIEARIRDSRYTGNHLTCLQLGEKIAELTGRKQTGRQNQTGFFDHCEAIIDDMRDGKIQTKQGKKYSAGTLRNYDNYMETFREYNADLTWNDITLKWYGEFIKWCNEQDYSLNYIGQHINKLIVLMNEAKRRGYHNNTAHLDDQFRRLKEDTDDITLEPEELAKIYNQYLPTERLAVARDWFIIGCYLGLRVSDVQLLDEHNIEKGRVTIANEKTDTKVVIPVRPEIIAIRKKWKGWPPKITDVELSRTIKDICQLVGIDETVLYFLTKGGQRRDFYLKKYEMVSPHTMRRCFITHLLEQGFADNVVMQLAGIKKHSTLLRYKKTTPEKNAENVKGHAYFKGK